MAIVAHRLSVRFPVYRSNWKELSRLFPPTMVDQLAWTAWMSEVQGRLKVVGDPEPAPV